MEVVQGKEVVGDGPALKHRGSGLTFRELFKGDEADIPNNYLMVLAGQRSFYSPVHRHNFDQFRLGVRGTISILPDLDVGEGELCYHPEGVRYGPQDDGDEPREVLVLQFGGASGQGFLSHAQLAKAQEALGARGRFEKGRFIPSADGEESVDAFQALWEHCQGRTLEYPRGRYDRPVKMVLGNYEWKGEGAARKKTLGVFSERETRAEVWLVDGTWDVPAENATQLFYVLSGSGTTGEGERLGEETAARLKSGQKATITGDGLEILRYVLPII